MNSAIVLFDAELILGRIFKSAVEIMGGGGLTVGPNFYQTTQKNTCVKNMNQTFVVNVQTAYDLSFRNPMKHEICRLINLLNPSGNYMQSRRKGIWRRRRTFSLAIPPPIFLPQINIVCGRN
jgi:hypothetical protein